MDRSRWATTAALTATDPTLAPFFLDRLTDLAEQLDSATVPQERVALAHALFGLFLDCLDLDLGVQARAIMARHASTRLLAGSAIAA